MITLRKKVPVGLSALLLGLLAALAVACEKEPEAWRTGDRKIDKQIETLLKLDLTEAVQKTKAVDPGDHDLATELPAEFRQLFNPKLTDGEKRQIGAMVMDDGIHLTGSDKTIAAVMKYYAREGKLPPNGAVYLTYAEESAYAALMASTPERQLTQIYAAINPVTGRIHESFTRTDWHPGGLLFEPTSDEKVKAKLDKRFKPDNPSKPMEYWQVTFFGELPERKVLAVTHAVSNGKKIIR